MLTLTPEQFAILALPDPYVFADDLAPEIRRDFPSQVASLDDPSLRRDVVRSYTHASDVLKITHLPTLVAWVRADVAWAKGLRSEPSIDLCMRNADNANRVAKDVLSGLVAGAGWPSEQGN